jgi:hypothetical protein
MKVRLDSSGIAAMLRSSPVARVVEDAAESVRAQAEGDPAVVRNGVPVRVRTGTSDRARAVVALAHPAGIGIQAKHGSLSRAVSAAGLSLRSKE